MKGGNISLSLNQVRGANNKTDNQVYLSVSKPLSTENQNASYRISPLTVTATSAMQIT
ncbi:Uncharacterised protein [Providencia rettgeri]|nr:Uncharacterised protein [Providencia rettgeri]